MYWLLKDYTPSVRACSAGKMCRSNTQDKFTFKLACRAREKVHRPQTRRRRENNEDSLDKMQQMRKNIRKAVEIMEHLVRREHKKLHIAVSPLLLSTGTGFEAFPTYSYALLGSSSI